MSRFSQTVRVVANPYHQLDHKGRPCGVVPVEPSVFGGHLGFVGAKIDRKNTKVVRKQSPGDIRGDRQDTVFEFTAEPVKVSKTPYYLDALKSGALFPADEASARAMGLKAFVPPATALAQAKKAAEEAFEREYGQGSLKELGHPEPEPAPEEKKPAAPSPDKAAPNTPSASSKGDAKGSRRGASNQEKGDS